MALAGVARRIERFVNLERVLLFGGSVYLESDFILDVRLTDILDSNKGVRFF